MIDNHLYKKVYMKNGKVAFFKPVVNFIINHIKGIILTIIVVITVACFPYTLSVVKNFIAVNDIENKNFLANLITTGISLLIPAISAIILHILKKWKRYVTTWKRKIYRKCLYVSQKEHSNPIAFVISKLIIYIFYYQKREIIGSQQRIVNDILNELNAHPTERTQERVFWIQGSPYSGKTTTILNLFVDLISKKEYCDLFEQLDGQIIYLDFGRDDFCINQLISSYRYGKYENCLLVLDNLHKISDMDCSRAVSEIVDNMHAFSIIILLRNPEDFLCDSEQVLKLNNYIHTRGKCYPLSELSPAYFSVYKETAFNEYCNQLKIFEESNYSHAVIVHMTSLYVRQKSDKWGYNKEIQAFLSGEIIQNNFLTKGLIIIVSASIFTGSFNIEILEKCSGTRTYNWKSFIQKLLDIGFLVRYPDSSNKYYYFHESVAKFYFQRSYPVNAYKSQYITCFEQLFTYYAKSNPMLSYLYSIPASDMEKEKNLFDNVIININFINFYNELAFQIANNEEKRKNYYRELGILCDRIGELKEAKEYYLNYLKQAGSPDAFYKLVEIDHDYIYKYPQISSTALESNDVYEHILSLYWDLHIKLHEGIFEFTAFIDLAVKGQEYCEDIYLKHPYDSLHLLRRIYFDLLRVYYLSGELNAKKILFLTKPENAFRRFLEIHLGEFKAYYIKFVVGQYLVYDILFSLAFLNRSIERNVFNEVLKPFVSLKFEEMHDYRKVAEEAILQYQESIELFEKVGDKTAIFTKYHMYGVKLVLINDGNFTECEQFYEEYMAFATREGDAEYQSYAELYKLKLLLVKISSPAVINDDPFYDMMKNQIMQKIELVRTYQRMCNIKRGNAYSELRIDMYELLYKFLIGKKDIKSFKNKLNSIKRIAKNFNYQRELYLIRFIEEYEYNLNREQLRIIFTFYPIITQ